MGQLADWADNHTAYRAYDDAKFAECTRDVRGPSCPNVFRSICLVATQRRSSGGFVPRQPCVQLRRAPGCESLDGEGKFPQSALSRD